jgi:hypothetical protein
MTKVPDAPSGANPPPAPHVDLADPAARAEWLASACEQTADIIAAGLDATAPPALRMLGRCAARENITKAARSLALCFAAVGLDLAAPRSAIRLRREQAGKPGDANTEEQSDATTAKPDEHEDEDAREVAQLGAAVSEIVRARDDGGEQDALHAMPIAGVLFLALMGTPDEQAEIDGPLVLALRAIRATVEGWARARGGSTVFASVPFADLDLLARRIDATIEIARRTARGAS